MARPVSVAPTTSVIRAARRAIVSRFPLRRCRNTGRRGPQQISEAVQLARAEIGHHPPVHSATRPVNHVVALPDALTDAGIGRSGSWPHVNVDPMLTGLVNQYRPGAPLQRIEPAAGQRKSLRGEVGHWRRVIELAVEPGL